MTTSDGSVVGTTKLVDNGPDEDKWNLVVTGDGFTAAELGAFEAVVDDFVTFLPTQSPFAGSLTWDKVNVHRIDVESSESGADSPDCDGSLVATYFDAEFCVGGTDRLLYVDESIVIDTANVEVPEWDALLVFVNSTVYGGGGGQVAVASLYDPDWIALHEMGHAAFGLADEYCSGGGSFVGSEPVEPNVTAAATLADLANVGKWADSIDPATPVPTASNPNCTLCDTQASPVPVGTVGLFEGAKYVACGCYRPEYDCLMNNLYIPYCSICTGVVLDTLTWGSLLDLTPCLVASAAYGDRLHPDVVTIRRWRDRHLRAGASAAALMRLLVAVYRHLSPPLARVARSRPRLARLLRTAVFAPWARALRRHEGSPSR